MTYLGKTVILAAVVALPGMAIAGGYGTAGVKDARVGNAGPETAMVWCPKLRAEVPIRLQQQMDCSEGVAVGTAEPAVARERFGGGLFGLPAHVPSGPRSALNDDETPPGAPTNPTNPTDPTDNDDPTPTPTPDDDDDTPPTGGQPKTKWERLADFGVNGSNFDQQSDDFLSSVQDFREANGGYGGDWSGFNPSTTPAQE